MVSVVYIQLSISTMLTERHIGLNQKSSDLSSDRLGGLFDYETESRRRYLCLESLFDVSAVVQVLPVP